MSRWDHWTENGGLLAREALNLIYIFLLLFLFFYSLEVTFLYFDIISIGKRDFDGKNCLMHGKIDIFRGFRTDLPVFGMGDLKFFPDIQNLLLNGKKDADWLGFVKI